MTIDTYIGKIRHRETPFYDFLYRYGKTMLRMSLPPVPFFSKMLFNLRWLILFLKDTSLRMLYYRQIFSQKVYRYGTSLKLSDIPYVMNDGIIEIGDNASIGKNNSWFVGIKYQGAREKARLTIGSNVSLNFGTYISVADQVKIGNNVKIAERVMIFDNNSHPLDPDDRRRGALITDNDVAPVIIEDDVWVGTCSLIMKGVVIGEGSVVAAASVVTKDVPPFTLVGGNPAKVLKRIR